MKNIYRYRYHLDHYPFNGWDYTELADAWNLPHEIGKPRWENMIKDDGESFGYKKLDQLRKKILTILILI